MHNGSSDQLVPIAPDDVAWIVRCLPSDVRDALSARPNSAILAGGFPRACIAREQKSDIDLFVSSVAEAESLVADLLIGRQAQHTENATTLTGSGLPIQIVHKWTYNDPAEALTSFDFSIAAAGIWWESQWLGLCHKDFYRDLAAKRLRYTGSDAPGGSMLRVLKFISRGYRIAPLDLSKIIADLVGGWHPDRDGDGAGGGLDQVICKALREVDPTTPPSPGTRMEAEAGRKQWDDSDPFRDE